MMSSAANNEPEFSPDQHRRIYEGFTSFTKWATIFVILIVVFLFAFVL